MSVSNETNYAVGDEFIFSPFFYQHLSLFGLPLKPKVIKTEKRQI